MLFTKNEPDYETTIDGGKMKKKANALRLTAIGILTGISLFYCPAMQRNLFYLNGEKTYEDYVDQTIAKPK